ncbi:MAG: hypothetical protein NZV14_14860 [Bryobacteraceae bacterium]|nr:hypothetical protein [Bryobacteraceae bacterium]MDW8379444.1 hypothetical protein [Bryobacterales bacterium]
MADEAIGHGWKMGLGLTGDGNRGGNAAMASQTFMASITPLEPVIGLSQVAL